MPARAQHSGSLRAITARQLQALVRQTRLRYHLGTVVVRGCLGLGQGSRYDAEESNEPRKRRKHILDPVWTPWTRGVHQHAQSGPEYRKSCPAETWHLVAEPDEPTVGQYRQRGRNDGPEDEAGWNIAPAEAEEENDGGPQPCAGAEEAAVACCELARGFHVLLRLCLPNGSRLSCGALKKDSFHYLRAPPASSAC